MRHLTTILLASLAALALALVPLPPPTMALTRPAMPSDFDGDGYADLAIGVPMENVGSKVDAGAVNVLYGSATGLTAVGDQYWTQDTAGVKGVSRGAPRDDDLPGDHFGRTLASGDFDGDGFADLAIGVPWDGAHRLAGPPFDVESGGGVNVLYGGPSGLSAAGDQLWTLASVAPAGIGWDQLAGALVAGDFDGDGYADLAVSGRRFERVEDGSSTCGATVLYGSAGGLGVDGAIELVLPVQGWCVVAMAAGRLDADAFAELVVGDRSAGDPSGSGFVAVYPGTAEGVGVGGADVWSQETAGIEDQAEIDDGFGASLAVGDLDADGFGDLAIAVPGEGADGAVAVIYGSAAGLTAGGNQLWPGVGGSALATGDFDGDGPADLAIGDGREDGSVDVLYGTAAGLTSTRWQHWTQASPGVPSALEADDHFGASLASANYGRSSKSDLAIGVPWENQGGVVNAGMVNVLYGRASGLSSTNAQGWWQNSAGVKGTAERNDLFGWVLTP